MSLTRFFTCKHVFDVQYKFVILLTILCKNKTIANNNWDKNLVHCSDNGVRIQDQFSRALSPSYLPHFRYGNFVQRGHRDLRTQHALDKGYDILFSRVWPAIIFPLIGYYMIVFFGGSYQHRNYQVQQLDTGQQKKEKKIKHSSDRPIAQNLLASY